MARDSSAPSGSEIRFKGMVNTRHPVGALAFLLEMAACGVDSDGATVILRSI